MKKLWNESKLYVIGAILMLISLVLGIATTITAYITMWPWL
jgi:hypothetical protein